MGPSNYDWTLPPEPIRLARWVAAHRILVRIILACIDVAVLAFLIAGIVHGTNHWNSYLQPLAWALLTYNFGWGMPRTVDTWNRRQNQEQPPGSDSPAD